MRNRKIGVKSSIFRNERREGDKLENQIARKIELGEPLDGGAPTIFTVKKDGVQAGYDIRTDRFELAVDALDAISKNALARAEGKADLKIVKDTPDEGDLGEVISG